MGVKKGEGERWIVFRVLVYLGAASRRAEGTPRCIHEGLPVARWLEGGLLQVER